MGGTEIFISGLDNLKIFELNKEQLVFLLQNKTAIGNTYKIFKTIKSKVVTYDFARMMDGATEVGCMDFGKAIIGNM